MNEKLYVVKTSYGAYLTLHSNQAETYYSVTSLEYAMKYTKAQLKKLYLAFKEKWNNDNLEVYEVVLSEKRSFDWTA